MERNDKEFNLDDKELRRLAVESALATTFRELRNPYLTWEALKELIVVSFPDHARVRSWLDEIRKFRNNGGQNTYPSQFPKIELLRDETLVAVCERVNNTDPLTVIAAMNYATQIYFDFQDFNPDVFIKPFIAHNGILVQISGLMGSGKTDFGLLIAEFLLTGDYVVITNVKCKDANRIIRGQVIPGGIPNLYLVNRMTDLLLQCIAMRRQNRNVVILWDETSLFMHRQSASTKENIGLSMFLRLIRKFSANAILIEQIEGGLATVADIMLVAKFQKLSKKRCQYSTITLEKNYNLFLENVPATRIKFDTLDFAGFRMDIDFKQMFEDIDVDAAEKIDAIEEYIRGVIKRDELAHMPIPAMQEMAKVTKKIKKVRKKKLDGS